MCTQYGVVIKQTSSCSVFSGENSPVSRNTPSRSRWSDDEEMKGF